MIKEYKGIPRKATNTQMIFYGQQGEDVFIYNHFLNTKRTDGTFVELGGMDGITYSNSKFFEDELGYTGVLIEPTPQYHKMIQYRPHCKNFNVAVSTEVGRVRIKGTHATAGLVETMHPDFEKRFHGATSETYEVGAMPLSMILKMAGIQYIDFLSIDVEGGEFVVLSTMDFDIPVYVIAIELDGYNEEKDQSCRDILTRHGFTCKKRLGNNEFWTNDSYFRRDGLYDSTIPKIARLDEESVQFACLEHHVREEVQESL